MKAENYSPPKKGVDPHFASAPSTLFLGFCWKTFGYPTKKWYIGIIGIGFCANRLCRPHIKWWRIAHGEISTHSWHTHAVRKLHAYAVHRSIPFWHCICSIICHPDTPSTQDDSKWKQMVISDGEKTYIKIPLKIIKIPFLSHFFHIASDVTIVPWLRLPRRSARPPSPHSSPPRASWVLLRASAWRNWWCLWS